MDGIVIIPRRTLIAVEHLTRDISSDHIATEMGVNRRNPAWRNGFSNRFAQVVSQKTKEANGE